MALSRSRRANAGSKMSILLNSMESDDFYTTQYGGFVEEDADQDFICEAKPITDSTPADVDDDIVDSDFSIDEDDEPRSDVENENDPDKAKRPKRGHGVQTKAYKEPKRDQPKPKPKQVTISVPASERPAKPKRESMDVTGRKLTRASTVNKTVETVKRQRERAIKAQRMLKRKLALRKMNTSRQLTQEEVLEEAKETEKLNLESLKRFQQMEIEAKQQAMKASQRSIRGPFIQYRSTSMPLPQVLPKKSLNSSGNEDKICVDDSEDVKENSSEMEEDNLEKSPEEEKQERTFITFSDFDTFRENFPISKSRVPQPKICPITRLPAKYFDPVTRHPYANLQAFRILREAYYSQLELKGDRNDPEVAAWLDWRAKNKPSKPPLQQMIRPQASFTQPLANASPVTNITRTVTSTPLTPTLPVAANPLAAAPIRQPATSIVMTPTPSNLIHTTRTIVSTQQPQQQPQQQQQSVVLPARTTPLSQSPSQVTQLLQTSQAGLVHSSGIQTQQISGGMQSVKIGGQTTQVNVTGSPRTITTTNLTPQQLQQFAANRGTAIAMLRASAITTGQRTQLISRPSINATVSPSAMIKPQSVTGQVTLQQPQQARSQTIALQRPSGQGLTTQTIAIQQGGIRTSGGQILVGSGGTTGGRAQQILLANPGQHGVRQVIMTTQGGSTPVRQGQIVQVGGQQHQLVVSQSGQYILSPQTNKQQQQQQQ